MLACLALLIGPCPYCRTCTPPQPVALPTPGEPASSGATVGMLAVLPSPSMPTALASPVGANEPQGSSS